MKILYLVGIIIIIVSVLPWLLPDQKTTSSTVDASVLDNSFDKITSNLKEVSEVVKPINLEIAGIENKYKKAITSYDKIKKEANSHSKRDDVFGSSNSSKVVTVESLTEILALNNELTSVKSSVEQINSKISNTEAIVASEIMEIKGLLQKTNSITKTGFSYERLLRTVSTFMGMVVLFFSYKNDKRQTKATVVTEE